MSELKSVTDYIATAPEGRMGPMKSINVNGVATAYHDEGEGEIILLVYGGNFGGSNSNFGWDLNFRPLAKKHRVVAVDRLGQGYTAPPLRDEDYTMQAVIEHIAAFVRTLGLPPVHIVGHSRGGFIATRLTLLYPELVRSLTIVTSGTLSPRISTNEIALSGAPTTVSGRERSRWMLEHYCYEPNCVTEDWMDRTEEVQNLPYLQQSVRDIRERDLMNRIWAPGLARDKRETHQWLAEGRLQRPTQILWALRDPTVLPEGAYDLFDTIRKYNRHVEVLMFNQTGHIPFRDYPEHFNAQLSGFVEEVSNSDA